MSTGPQSRTRSGTTPRVPRVLVVDDEPYVAEAMQLLLSDEFDVTSTTRPTEALERLLGGEWYDVVLCDVMMPGLDGVELRNRVHAVAPELAARIVFVTGGIVHERVRRLVESVPNTLLEKPVDLDALRALVRRRAGVLEPTRPASERA